MAEKIKTKRGDTFCLKCTYRNEDDERAELPEEIRSQIRTTKGDLVQELDIERLDEKGDFELTAKAKDTEGWDTGKHECDIEYTEDGRVFSTETFEISVVEDITYDED